jgi:uncharacterized protein with HEPN domain
MRLEARKYLFDIQLAADSIAAFCAGKNFEQYRSDDLLRAAVRELLGKTD